MVSRSQRQSAVVHRHGARRVLDVLGKLRSLDRFLGLHLRYALQTLGLHAKLNDMMMLFAVHRLAGGCAGGPAHMRRASRCYIYCGFLPPRSVHLVGPVAWLQ